MLQHLTSSGRKSACLILVLCLCQAKLSPTLLCYRDSLRAPGAGSLWARCARTRAASRGRAEHPPHQCSVFGKMGHSGMSRYLSVTGDEEMRQLFLSCWVFEVSHIAKFCYIFSRLLTQMKISKYFWVQSYS